MTSFSRELQLLLEAGGWTAQVHTANTACHLILYNTNTMQKQSVCLSFSMLVHQGGKKISIHTHYVYRIFKPCIQ